MAKDLMSIIMSQKNHFNRTRESLEQNHKEKKDNTEC